MGRQFGNYEILRKLASGGMAEVFLAKHRGLGGFERLVCIKRILPHLSEQEDFIKMFQDEARIVANLIHPHIAQIYDIGQLDDTYYIAMEYVRGEALRRVYNGEVARGRAMPVEPAAHIAMGAASGLDFAHRQTSIDGRPMGIVHRDVSPQNVLVTYDGHVKLIDFGVAKAEGKLNETRSGVLKGKYSYMSPEQASGDPIDGRTDIFALGITIYEVTTGVRLFKRESEIETLHAVIECNVTAPGELVPGYDEELQEIVMRALAHDPDERFATAGDMERALERFLVRRGHPTSASSLAAYMQDLFAEKLADELLFGGQPWEETLTPGPGDRNATREHETNEEIDLSATERTGHSEVTEEDTEISKRSDAAFEDTIIEDESGSDGPPSATGAVWGVPDDWATSAESVSQTTTQMASGEHEPSRGPPRSGRFAPRPSTPIAEQPTPASSVGAPRPGRWFSAVALGALVVGTSVAVGLVISSQRRDPTTAPRSGMLAVDSEPRGARVVFVGPDSAALNAIYEGHRTPFTIAEGVPVENALKLRFIKDGYEIAEAPLPDLEPGVVPEPLFVELPTGAEGAETGALVVLSDPAGAQVWVDGTKVEGKTPLNDVRVRGGEMHRVELHLPGHETRWESVYVEPGARRFVEVELFPLDGGAPAEPGPAPDIAAPHGVPPDPPAKKAPARKTPGGRAYLTVVSPMKLRVTVDRRYVGETPIRKLAVEAGVRNVRLKSESEGFLLRRRVRLGAGHTELLDVRPRRGKLSLNAAPWAWVRVGKESPAETPVRLAVFEGEYNVMFECPDGRRKRETARVFAGQTTSVSVSCRD